jgi:hypothetical protein
MWTEWFSCQEPLRVSAAAMVGPDIGQRQHDPTRQKRENDNAAGVLPLQLGDSVQPECKKSSYLEDKCINFNCSLHQITVTWHCE